jgi:hypothetical protein
MIVYDIEIANAIPDKKSPIVEGIRYCEGWRDFAGMGIATIAAYDVDEQRSRVFFADNLGDFADLVERYEVIASFNGDGFDSPLLAANGVVIPPEKSYDLLVEVWKAAGLGPNFHWKTHMGYGLDALCQANLGTGKTSNGALAPINFQRGHFGAVVDYNLADTWLTWRLIQRVIGTGKLICPKSGKELSIATPKGYGAHDYKVSA